MNTIELIGNMMIILFGFILKLIIIDTILEELKYLGMEVPNILIIELHRTL